MASACIGAAPKGGNSTTTATSPRWQHGEARVALDPEKEEGRGGERSAGQVRSSVGLLIRRGHGNVRGQHGHGGMGRAAWLQEEEEKVSRKPPGFNYFNCKKVPQQLQ